MAYAEYLVWLDEEGPIRGGRRGDKFKELTFLYLAEEGMNRKLSDTSRGRLDFVGDPPLIFGPTLIDRDTLLLHS